ncbi:hypothetical protein COU75_00135 [Candidatus Peregrinibacteria bacterium CG10_big_fil_rev_8_21_14_0_10_42_8]|nr:MAG: hypothetical protein COU75_00135 [Candidatus Peregrinibacteria bacterium CG10_big_fil_rev_8_21_14_0_10_42_8]
MKKLLTNNALKKIIIYIFFFSIYILTFLLSLFIGLSLRFSHSLIATGETLLSITYATFFSGPIALALLTFVILLILTLCNKLKLINYIKFIIATSLILAAFFTFKYDFLLDISKVFFLYFK